MTLELKAKFDLALDEMEKRFRISYFAMVCYELGVKEKDLKTVNLTEYLEEKAINTRDGYWEKKI